MEWWVLLIIVFAALFLGLATGMEIAAALGVIGIVGFIFIIDHPLMETTRLGWDITNSFILTAVPLFIFMGEVFLHSGVTQSLFSGATKWVGRLPGGLNCSIVGACAIFAAISGSSPATAATIGTIAIPEMEKRNYNMTMTMGTIAAGGTLGILIPPSINLIIYGAWQGVSVPELFAGGMIPGIILAGLFMVGIMIVVSLRPSLAPKADKASWKDRLFALREMAPWFILIGIILGAIFGGIMTPTEAAGVGAVLSLIMAAAYRRLSFTTVKESALATLRLTSMILFIIVGAQILAFLLQSERVGLILAEQLLTLDVSKYVLISLIFGMYILLGCVMDALSAMVLTLPIITPIITGLGFDLIWFGIPLVITMETGMITPPFGINLFVLRGVAPQYEILTVAKGAAPFLIPMVMVIGLLMAFPELALWLPSVIVG